MDQIKYTRRTTYPHITGAFNEKLGSQMELLHFRLQFNAVLFLYKNHDIELEITVTSESPVLENGAQWTARIIPPFTADIKPAVLEIITIDIKTMLEFWPPEGPYPRYSNERYRTVDVIFLELLR